MHDFTKKHYATHLVITRSPLHRHPTNARLPDGQDGEVVGPRASPPRQSVVLRAPPVRYVTEDFVEDRSRRVREERTTEKRRKACRPNRRRSTSSANRRHTRPSARFLPLTCPSAIFETIRSRRKLSTWSITTSAGNRSIDRPTDQSIARSSGAEALRTTSYLQTTENESDVSSRTNLVRGVDQWWYRRTSSG